MSLPVISAISRCPKPPADFGNRPLPVMEFSLSSHALYRIHRTIYGPLFHNRKSTSNTIFRFDAPADEYGVLYASESFDACMAETVIRDRFQNGTWPLIIDLNELSCRSVSRLGLLLPRSLRLANLEEPLFSLGASTQILSDPDYHITNLWSRAIHAHPENVDGIYFRSRYANDFCVAIFDRVELITCSAPVALLSFPGIDDFLDKHQIGIV